MTRRLLADARLVGNGGEESALLSVPNLNEKTLTFGIACYGILAATALLAAIVFLVFRFLKISLRQKNQLGMLMGIGICSLVFWEICLRMQQHRPFGAWSWEALLPLPHLRRHPDPGDLPAFGLL
mgnify:CR=1 FL=1